MLDLIVTNGVLPGLGAVASMTLLQILEITEAILAILQKTAG